MPRGPRKEDKSHTTLDALEQFVRDDLSVDLSGWVRFRHRINLGSHSGHLYFPNKQLSTKGKKEAYLDIGKSLTEIVSCLGMARITQSQLSQLLANSSSEKAFLESFLEFLRQAKLFYFLVGCITDNLARVVYTLRHKDSHKRGKEKTKRRKIGFGAGANGLKKAIDDEQKKLASHKIVLADCIYANYKFMYGHNVIKVLNVRHFLTHVWCPFTVIDQRHFCWPTQIWSDRVYAWPHDQLEAKPFGKLTFARAAPRFEKDFAIIEKLVNTTLKQLTKDVPDFEQNYCVIIQPIIGGINRKRK